MTDMRLVVQTPWTDEERTQLRRLAENGLSRAQIGKMLGRTKNSVHSQMRYMGLCAAPSPRRQADPTKRKHVRTRTEHQVPVTTLPPLPSLSMRADGECGWPAPEAAE